MQSAIETTRILLLARPGSAGDQIVQRLGNEVQVRTVTSFEDALVALREAAYDVVISDQSDYIALERAAVNQQSAVILENIGQGVCIVGLDGRLIWANPKMRSYPEDLIKQVGEVCRRSFGAGAEPGGDPLRREGERASLHRARRVSLTAGRDNYFEVTITPVVNHDEQVRQVAAVVWDVTNSRRLQKKLDAIDLAGRELVRLDAEKMAGMNVEERIQLLEQKMLRYMHDLLHFDNFAVLLIDKKTNRMEFVLQHGMTPKAQDYDIFASTESTCISGYVAATGRSYICHDTSKDPRYLQGLESARSSLTVPIRLDHEVIGVFNIESDQLAAFNEDDRQYAEILARYVAIALNILDLLIIERREATGCLADDVIAEISGPLNDIMTEASGLCEEYIGNDDLRHRLNAICDHVTEIKQKVKDVTTPKGGILGRGENAVLSDPILGGKRVLVADDEQTIRETIAGVLRKAGCSVEVVSDGAEAIARLNAGSYDLLVADIRMPVKNGYEVFAHARDRQPDIAVILMTGFGYDPNHSIVRARKEGLNAVLFKPFKVDQLLTEVRSAFQPATT
jgi:two-component system, sensor histidine kinase SagS